MSSDSQVADLSGFDIRVRAQEGTEMPLLDPAGRATNVVFGVRGSDAEAYNDKLKEQLRRVAERAPRKATQDERDAEVWELHATLVPWWTPAKIVFDKGGPALECTPANVAAVLERHAWVFEQVCRHSDKRANFLPGPETA